jgi:hypothetical protein
LSFDHRVVAALAISGLDAEFGARPLQRVRRDYVSDLLADIVLEESLPRGSRVHLSIDRDPGTVGGDIRRHRIQVQIQRPGETVELSHHSRIITVRATPPARAAAEMTEVGRLATDLAEQASQLRVQQGEGAVPLNVRPVAPEAVTAPHGHGGRRGR